MYVIDLDKSQELISVRLSGMLMPDEVAEYVAELARQITANRLRHYAMVIDVTECPIQHQDTIGAFGRHMATMPKARALAIVTGSSLARMQVRRLFTQPYARVAATVAEARAWVLDGVEPTTA